jgi:hypothetical protein
MNTVKSFLHVLIIGSASNTTSEGQIPDPITTRNFIDSHPTMTVYLYFIDPNHRSRPEDWNKFSQLMDAEIPLTVINQNFLIPEISKNYKIFPEDSVLLIDYAGIATCEQEWIELVGNRKNWYFWVPGCYGKRLDLTEAWREAHSWIQHTIHSEFPVPKSLSKNHKQYLLVELNLLLLYSRLLPSSERDPDPPNWLRERDPVITGSDKQTWISIQHSAEFALHNFMKNNGIDMRENEQKKWVTIVRQILDGSLSAPSASQN